jgi:hypothetical protein
MDTELAKNPEKYIGQKRIWISEPDDKFQVHFIRKIFTISGIKTDMSNVMYFTYYYGKTKSDNRRDIKEVLEHSAELSPVLKELFDI